MTPTKHSRFSEISRPAKPLLIVISGLSGVGKDTVLAGLRKAGLPAVISISATTRARRPSEKEGIDYYFVSKDKFHEMIEDNQLLEHAEVYGNYYGIPRKPVREWLGEGKDVIVKIDVQGAATIKKNVPGAILIFLCTLTLEELEKRLKKRRTESPEELELRLKTAEKELDQMEIFDYVLVNRENEVERTIADVQAIIRAEKSKVSQKEIKL